jgi:hypothetical protein
MPTGTSIARRRTLQAIGVLGLVGCSSGVLFVRILILR